VRKRRLLFLAALSIGGAFVAVVPAASSTAHTATASAMQSGCGNAVSIGSTTLTLNVDNYKRTVIVHIPSGYKSKTKVPLVLNMHGSGATALDQELFTGMDATADRADFIVAYPQGLIPDGSGFDWNVPGVPLIGGKAVPKNAANDVEFLTDLVTALGNRYCIDTNRVYATGFSGGARMASQLACDASNIFAAVAPVSGLRHPSPCPETRDVPIISFHGTVDPVDPYKGHGQAYWVYSVPQAAQFWGLQEACSKKPLTSDPENDVTLTKYQGCRGNSVVELYSINGEGHEWPGGPLLPTAITRALGPQSNAINANQTIWAFFKAHPLA